MKKIKLFLLIAMLPSIMILTTKCSDPRRGPDIDIDRYLPSADFIECLNDCESARDQIDYEYRNCLEELLKQFLSKVEACRYENKVPPNFNRFMTCLKTFLKEYEQNTAECTLRWEEGKEEIKVCKQSCISEEMKP